ncbi:alpha/beta fold hydrolase [Shewanella gaetbuli]|uniref:Alpha/beta fold hydrolase n=1 Tax=Shewanella gaetbuli TaxID=220752 RepID=A0A9X2CLC1_9GAMM|nr:alpha/beta fold hydrolase [Shewanella gaetbuli]MCL1142579.1 alpha/beta fold hydrolase [Shewanella gaetbuli]
MHYEVSGSGTPVILIHGLFGNLDNLKALAKSLEPHFTVVRIDVPNHGLSEHWHTMDYPSLAEALISLIDQLGFDTVDLVGHSMGGKIAMATALLYPQRISKVVAADIAPVSYSPRHNEVFEAMESLSLEQLISRTAALSHLTSNGIDEGTAQFLLKNLQRNTHGFSWKLNLSGLKANYQHIIGWSIAADNKVEPYNKPCFFIRGGDSEYVLPEHKQQIMAQFPNVSVKTLYGTGHWLHAQKPDIFNRLVTEFLQKKPD